MLMYRVLVTIILYGLTSFGTASVITPVFSLTPSSATAGNDVIISCVFSPSNLLTSVHLSKDSSDVFDMCNGAKSNYSSNGRLKAGSTCSLSTGNVNWVLSKAELVDAGSWCCYGNGFGETLTKTCETLKVSTEVLTTAPTTAQQPVESPPTLKHSGSIVQNSVKVGQNATFIMLIDAYPPENRVFCYLAQKYNVERSGFIKGKIVDGKLVTSNPTEIILAEIDEPDIEGRIWVLFLQKIIENHFGDWYCLIQNKNGELKVRLQLEEDKSAVITLETIIAMAAAVFILIVGFVIGCVCWKKRRDATKRNKRDQTNIGLPNTTVLHNNGSVVYHSSSNYHPGNARPGHSNNYNRESQYPMEGIYDDLENVDKTSEYDELEFGNEDQNHDQVIPGSNQNTSQETSHYLSMANAAYS